MLRTDVMIKKRSGIFKGEVEFILFSRSIYIYNYFNVFVYVTKLILISYDPKMFRQQRVGTIHNILYLYK